MSEIIRTMADEIVKLGEEKGIIGITCNFRNEGNNLIGGSINGYFLDESELKSKDLGNVFIFREEFSSLTDEWTQHEYPELHERNLMSLYHSHCVFDLYNKIENLQGLARAKFGHHYSSDSMKKRNLEFFKELVEELPVALQRRQTTVATFSSLRKSGCLNCGFGVFSDGRLIGGGHLEEKNFDFNELVDCPKCGTNYLLVHELLVNLLIEASKKGNSLRLYDNSEKRKNSKSPCCDEEISLISNRVRLKGWKLGKNIEK